MKVVDKVNPMLNMMILSTILDHYNGKKTFLFLFLFKSLKLITST
jgi:hypothetical protein